MISNKFNIQGNINNIGAVLGHHGGSSLLHKLGQRGGAMVGVVLGIGIFLKTGDVEAAMESIIPGASSVIAAMDGRELEAFMRGIEELPLGVAATEILRPLIRAVHDPKSVDPSILESICKKGEDYFLSSMAASPSTIGMEGSLLDLVPKI